MDSILSTVEHEDRAVVLPREGEIPPEQRKHFPQYFLSLLLHAQRLSLSLSNMNLPKFPNWWNFFPCSPTFTSGIMTGWEIIGVMALTWRGQWGVGMNTWDDGTGKRREYLHYAPFTLYCISPFPHFLPLSQNFQYENDETGKRGF